MTNVTKIENLIEQYDDAMSDRDIPLYKLLKAEIELLVALDHAEALRINKALDKAGLIIRAMKGADIEGVLAGIRGGMYRDGLDEIEWCANAALHLEVSKAHAEALGMNSAIDRMVDEYEHVAACEYDEREEMARLALVGNGTYENLPEVFGKPLFKQLRLTANRLYSEGYVSDPDERGSEEYIEECQRLRAIWAANGNEKRRDVVELAHDKAHEMNAELSSVSIH
ncbi:hypothetical protein ACUZIT_001627 [Enterobacter hormaechei]